jgi:hypothetical protein
MSTWIQKCPGCEHERCEHCLLELARRRFSTHVDDKISTQLHLDATLLLDFKYRDASKNHLRYTY